MIMNQIMTQEFAVSIAATVKKQVPILDYINTELSDKLVSGNGSGDTVDVLVPNFGKVSEGASFLPDGSSTVATMGSIDDLRVQVDKVQVKVGIKKVGASYDVLEKTLKLYTPESQIHEPRLSQLAKTVNSDVFKTVMASAHSSVVGPIGFPDLAEAVSYVEGSRVGDDTAGMLSPLLNNTIAASGANKFSNPSLASPKGTETNIYKGIIGEWQDATFFKSADAGVIKLGNTVAQEFAFNGDVANVNDGDTTLTLSNIAFGGSTLGFIPKGTPIIIGSGDPTVNGSVSSPFTVSNVYGDDTQIIRTFVVQEDAPIAGDAATVKVAKINLNQNIAGAETMSAAAVSNTWYSGDAAQTGLTFICPLMAGAKYALGAVFASKSVAFASSALRELSNNDSKSTKLEGHLNIRTSTGANLVEGAEIWRIDVCYGVDTLYGQGAVALYGLIV
jgi:hypothetical protein